MFEYYFRFSGLKRVPKKKMTKHIDQKGINVKIITFIKWLISCQQRTGFTYIESVFDLVTLDKKNFHKN